LIASVLDVDGGIRTSDFGGSLRAGTNAILSALDLADKGGRVLVSASDCRVPPGDGASEDSFGDGAAAFLFGNQNLIAEYVDSYSVSHDFHDIWRGGNEKYPHFFEEKYAQSMGYTPFIVQSFKGLLEKCSLKPNMIQKVVIDGVTDKRVQSLLKPLGLQADQLQKSLIPDFGYTGTAYAPMMLASALEDSHPGDLILYVSYGERSDAILFRAGEGCSRPGNKRGAGHFRMNKKCDMTYEKYLRWKKRMDFEPARRPDYQRSNLPDYYRKAKKNLAGYGSICEQCGTPHFPPSRICVKCKSVDKMKPYLFRGRRAYLATYTLDNIGISEDSPNVFAIVDFEGGGRMFTYMMDCYFDKIEIGMEVELVYRNMFTADGINTYFWKCIPARHGGGEKSE
jgi:3-hydroxy-3-methylglutaryl CoA synthase